MHVRTQAASRVLSSEEMKELEDVKKKKVHELMVCSILHTAYIVCTYNIMYMQCVCCVCVYVSVCIYIYIYIYIYMV